MHAATYVSVAPTAAVDREVPKVVEAVLPAADLVEAVSALEVSFSVVLHQAVVLAESLIAQPSLVPSQFAEVRLVLRWQSGVPLGSGQAPKVQHEALPATVAGSVATVEVVGFFWP